MFQSSLKNVLNNGFDFDKTLTFNSTLLNGSQVQSELIFPPSQPTLPAGHFNLRVPVKTAGSSSGSLTVDVQSREAEESSFVYRFDKLGSGQTLALGYHSRRPKSGAKSDFPAGWLSATYQANRDLVRATLKARSNIEKTLLEPTLILGSDSLSFGANINLDTASRAMPNDFNVGIRYTDKDMTAIAETKDARSKLLLGFSSRVFTTAPTQASALSTSLDFAGSVTHGLAAPSRQIHCGVAYNHSDPTPNSLNFLLKTNCKFDTETPGQMTVSNAYTARLRNPDFSVRLCSEFDVAGSGIQKSRFGVGLQIGD